MEKKCEANHCSNVIRGRRGDAKYCCESCKQVQKRYNKENNISSSPRIASTLKTIPPSGDLINDVSMNAALGLMNGNINSSIGHSVLNSCAPYAIDSIKRNPVRSFLLSIGGFFIGKYVFSSCTTTTTEVNGKKNVAKTCKEASKLEKSGSVVASVLAGNYLLDAIYSPNIDASDTGQTRVRHGSNTVNHPLIQYQTAN